MQYKLLLVLLGVALIVVPAQAEDQPAETDLATQQSVSRDELTSLASAVPDFMFKKTAFPLLRFFLPLEQRLAETNLETLGLTGIRTEVAMGPHIEFTHRFETREKERTAVFGTTSDQCPGLPKEVFLGMADQKLWSGRCGLSAVRVVSLKTPEQQYAFLTRHLTPEQ